MRRSGLTATSLVLNLLWPGLGHWYCAELLFGLFVFLVTLMATILYLVALFIELPFVAKLFIFGLPILFYLFSFVDLARTARNRSKNFARSRKATIVFLLIAAAYQLFSPIAPVNLGLMNLPEVFRMEDSSLSPVFAKGDLLKANHLKYYVRSYLLDGPLWYAPPARYDIVRFVDSDGRHRTGMLLGLPGERIVIVEGVVVVNDLPDFSEPPSGLVLSGDWPLTDAGDMSMLIATFRLGEIDNVHDVSLSGLVGRVSRLF